MSQGTKAVPFSQASRQDILSGILRKCAQELPAVGELFEQTTVPRVLSLSATPLSAANVHFAFKIESCRATQFWVHRAR